MDKERKYNIDVDGLWPSGILVLILAFYGEPDMWDAIIYWWMH